MATAEDVVTNALRRANYIASNETPEASDAAAALSLFNGRMQQLKSQGINLSWTDLALAGTVPLEDEYIYGVTAMLAVTLMSDVGDQPSPQLMKDAKEGFEALASGYRPIVPLVPDETLQNMPSQRRLSGYVNDGSN